MHAKGNAKGRKFSHAFAAVGDDQLDYKKRKVAHSSTLPFGSSKTSRRFVPIRGGRQWTISIAVPGSILSNLPTAEQRLVTVARLARSLSIFCVDEVIVYDDDAPSARNTTTRFDMADGSSSSTGIYTGDADPCHFVAQVLSFLECPPFMRRRLFPLHPNLRHTALLPALDMPHHPRAKAPWLPYAEGVTVTNGGEDADTLLLPDGSGGSLVDTGIGGLVRVADVIPPNTRVTLRFDGPNDAQQQSPAPVCVHPDEPRTKGGYYWGYAVRRSASLSGVFTECPHAGGYDLSVGTSERGTPLSQVMADYQQRQQQHQQSQNWRRGYHHHHHHHHNDNNTTTADAADNETPSFQHLLVVFGGPRGIELAAAHDPHLAAMQIRGAKTRELFDHWVNVLPGQGSRDIATDEAVPIALMGLRGLWERP
ncbi:putative methyltransferase [Beauveria bassiana]|nr:putative methyltransferase [Beauveria bassiana]KAH8712784.1 putative methyltransferase C9orf114 [Beauveria bassiana]